MTIHTTLADLIEQEITPALGEFAADYDIDGFVDELKGRDLIRWIQTGNASRDGYALVAEEAEFWTILADFDHAE